MIAVAGEALIDLVARDGVLRPFLGGGPFNTAVMLARLGVPAAFVGRISDDRFGQSLYEGLADSGVDLRYVLRGTAPTPLAVVHTSDGEAEYSFYLTGTAYAALTPADLPALDEAEALHVGTLALATDPPAATFEALMTEVAPERLVVVDPNVRPAVVGERDAYVRRFERWAQTAHVIKLSAADAVWLYPGTPVDEVVQHVLALGADLVVVTLGPDGALGRTRGVHAEAAAPRVEIVDTVGAGDAFGAGLLACLREGGRLDGASVAGIGAAELERALAFAAAIGALQCARAGAEPPTRADLDAFLATI